MRDLKIGERKGEEEKRDLSRIFGLFFLGNKWNHYWQLPREWLRTCPPTNNSVRVTEVNVERSEVSEAL